MRKETIKNLPMLRQSDIITHAKYNMSVYEKNILTCLIRAMQSIGFKSLSYTVDLNQIAIDTNTEYKEAYFYDALYKLRKRDFVERGQYSIFVGGFIDNFDFDKTNKKTIISISPQALKAYSNMSLYTKFDDTIQLQFDSYYTKRIYEQICKHAQKTVWYISVDGLREMLGLVDINTGRTKFKQFGQLRMYILEKAEESFKEKSEYIFTWKAHRMEGKKITWLRFDIYKNPKFMKLFDNKAFDTKQVEVIERLVKQFKLDDRQAEIIAQNFNLDIINNRLFDIYIRNQNKQIHGNINSYTVNVFHNMKPQLNLINKNVNKGTETKTEER